MASGSVAGGNTTLNRPLIFRPYSISSFMNPQVQYDEPRFIKWSLEINEKRHSFNLNILLQVISKPVLEISFVSWPRLIFTEINWSLKSNFTNLLIILSRPHLPYLVFRKLLPLISQKHLSNVGICFISSFITL